ncbi:UpxY family transcription antiterminator [Xylanibacter muris]|uniref:UpxY family transcription antiterminator n=1 Tax=Xylanibacter muris TaxID=2736290 RepID=A0ABX2AKM1_9BACT|nr:UpxY family transcription antiterminator [Xylanibacter muris]NPD91743.1 UpxY family transcription antiterminator [Xylanibacter muris]
MDNRTIPRFSIAVDSLYYGHIADMNALSDANTRRGGKEPPNIGLTSNVSPEAHSSQTGVSVRYAHDETRQWFVLRASYGRAGKACDIFDKKRIEYYLPLHHVIKIVNNKKKRILEPLLPNFIFVYAKEEDIRTFVGTTCATTLLSFYYNHFKVDRFGKNPPLTIDYKSMMNFIKATSTGNDNVRVVEPQSCRYKSGDRVKVIDGEFAGVEGKVARVAGQQRVIIELEGLCLIATAYIPSAFLKPLDNDIPPSEVVR